MPYRLTASLLALALSVLLSGSAWAINQPRGGPQIPVGDALQAVFRSRSEPFDARAAAAITPDRFVPGCRLNFTMVTRGTAGFMNAFGWYNVRPGMAPDPSDLHVLIPCTARAGDRFTLDLRSEPAYRGGEIGFFLRTPEDGTSGRCSDCCASFTRGGQTYFSERQYNPDNMGADSYIHLLIYDSRATANGFYFAWEDLFSGGDNNFTDFVALVDNIVCTGAGGACNTGMMGACSIGTQQCRSGALQCVQAVTPTPERCDGVDNNCDGMTDEGDGLCPGMQICERGACVDRCLGELGCFDGQVCTPRGACVDTACASMNCPAGQRCTMGRCVDACDGITCPHGHVCRVGRCQDPCAGVTCDSDQVCVAGVCTPRCECRRCASGEVCGSDGRCAPMACASTPCGAGQYCEAGTCRNACDGARCPTGERCQGGACVMIPVPDGGVRDATVDVPGEDVNYHPDAGSDDVPDASKDMDAAVDAGIRYVDDAPGCGCRASLGGASKAMMGWSVVGLALAARRRRRRRDSRQN